MVDREARRQLAAALKRLATGKITNDEYQDLAIEYAGTDDVSVREIIDTTYIGFDDPRDTYYLTGKHALSKKSRREVANWILFLHTDCEYEKRRTANRIKRLLVIIFYIAITFLTCGLNLLVMLIVILVKTKVQSHQAEAEFKWTGKIDIWPFRSKSDFDRALRLRILGSKTGPTV